MEAGQEGTDTQETPLPQPSCTLRSGQQGRVGRRVGCPGVAIGLPPPRLPSCLTLCKPPLNSLSFSSRFPVGMSDSVKDKFSIAFSIVGMFASHAVGSLSVFFCAEITPTVIRYVTGPCASVWDCLLKNEGMWHGSCAAHSQPGWVTQTPCPDARDSPERAQP